MAETETRIDERRGTWKRHICEWFGHENVGVRNLLWGTPETLCLRCRASAWVAPMHPFAAPVPHPAATDPSDGGLS